MIEKVVEEVLHLGTFEEVRKGGGQTLKYDVMTVSPELEDEVIRHMTEYFLPREPMCSNHNVHKDRVSVEAIHKFWRSMIQSGTSIVAIAEGPEDITKRVVGANIVYIAHKGDDLKETDGEAFKKVYYPVCDIADRSGILEKYGVDKYLSAFGLSVHPDFHGYKIGERILQCRAPLCRAIGIKVTGTVFTAIESQYISKKVGFVILYKEDYSVYKKSNGEIAFKGLPGCFEYSAWDFA